MQMRSTSISPSREYQFCSISISGESEKGKENEMEKLRFDRKRCEIKQEEKIFNVPAAVYLFNGIESVILCGLNRL